MLAPTPCIDCGEPATFRGRCPTHKRDTWINGQTRTSTAAHKRWRAAVLRRDPLCKIAGPNCTRAATQADHIINVAAGGAPYDLSNGQGVCAQCHREKTQCEAQAARRAAQTRA